MTSPRCPGSPSSAWPLATFALLLCGHCAKPPSKSCERTLTCAPAATISPRPDCSWLRPDGGFWDESPLYSDAGTWTWFGREVPLDYRCDPNADLEEPAAVEDAGPDPADAAVPAVVPLPDAAPEGDAALPDAGLPAQPIDAGQEQDAAVPSPPPADAG